MCSISYWLRNFFNNWFSSLPLITVLKDQGIRATEIVRTDRLSKELELNKERIIKYHYQKNVIDVICWNDNGPVAVISIFHADLPPTTVKRLDSSFRNHIKIDLPHCITKYNKYMDGIDSLDVLVSVYRIDVHGKKCYWPNYVITVDLRAAFNVFKLVNPDLKIDFLAFTCQVAIHYLIQTSFIHEKDLEKETQQFQKMKKKQQENHFIEKYSQKLCRACPNQPRTWYPICEVGLCMEPFFEAFHMI